MPKRILDGEAMWNSTKLSTVPEALRVEYAWFYPLADCNGSFEITSLRAIHAKVSVIRPRLVLRKIQRTLDEFERAGLLFVWTEGGKRYAHWTNSERPGRLPKASDRYKYQKLAPTVQAEKLAAFLASVESEKSPQTGAGRAINGRIGFGVGLGLGEGIGEGEGSGVGAPKIAAQSTPAKTACVSSLPVDEKEKPKPVTVLDPDESLRVEAERQKLELYKRFGKLK